jgi:hypothetical protein
MDEQIEKTTFIFHTFFLETLIPGHYIISEDFLQFPIHPIRLDRNVPRKPRAARGPCLPAGRKGRNINDITLPGSPGVPIPSLRDGRRASLPRLSFWPSSGEE